MMDRSRKRKRIVLTIEQKLEIIENKRCESITTLASKYGVGHQTVRDIIRNREKLEEFVSKSVDNLQYCITQRKTVKGSKFQKLDDAMMKWFMKQRSEDFPISASMCTSQAQKLHSELKIEGDFNASNGWLHRFRKRHGIRDLASRDNDGIAMIECCPEVGNEDDFLPETVSDDGEVTCKEADGAVGVLLNFFQEQSATEEEEDISSFIAQLRKMKEFIQNKRSTESEIS